jgi:membrane protein DedA with SNARE-associated domain
MLQTAALIGVSSSLGYLLPAIIGLESMGIPSPGETALVLAAVLASQGKLQIELVILIAAASAIIGDNVGYLIGRRFGRELLTAPGPFHRRRTMLIAVGDRFFSRHGSKAVFLGRWIALVRIAAAWLAGINHMKFRTFFVWNALGGITWAIAFGLAGYFGGHAAADLITRFGVYAGIGLAIFVVVAYVVLRIREHRSEHRAIAEAEAEAEAGAGDSPELAPDKNDDAKTESTRDPDPARRS